MKALQHVLLALLGAITVLTGHAQEVKLYSQQPFGSQVVENYQVMSRTYITGSKGNKDFGIKMPGNDILAYTAKGRSERLVLLLGAKNWLDLTDEVRITGSGVRFSRFLGKGVDNRTKANETAWVKLELLIDPSAAPGLRTIRLLRPSLMGKDESVVRLNLKENVRVHFRSSLVLNGSELSSRQAFNQDQEVHFTIYGDDLTLISGVRDPFNFSSIVSSLRIVSRFPADLSKSSTLTTAPKFTGGTSLSSLGGNTLPSQDRFGLQSISFATTFGREGILTTDQFYTNLLRLTPAIEVIDFGWGPREAYFVTNASTPSSGSSTPRMILIGVERDSERGIR